MIRPTATKKTRSPQLTAARPKGKPPRPAADFPLFPHARGYWAKKVQGRTLYFGPWKDPQGALRRYQRYLTTQATSLGAEAARTEITGAAKLTPGKAKVAPPEKPSSDYPLTPRANGQWGKKINGRWYYFGKWDEPQNALARYLRERGSLGGGRPNDSRGALVGDLLNVFLAAKEEKVRAREIEPGTYKEYEYACDDVAGMLGAATELSELTPADFQRLRSDLAKRYGKVRLGNMIQYVRSIFKYGFEFGLLDRPMSFGPDFKKPSKRVLRMERNKRPPRLFPPKVLRKLIHRADPTLKAMILLGINAGFGPTDCATLPQQAVDLGQGWIRYPRPKTGVMRRCPLWPETVKALQDYLAARPQPRERRNAKLFFITRKRCRAFCQAKKASWRVSGDMRRLLDRLGLFRDGLGFGALRHTFATVADQFGDRAAVKTIMGHCGREEVTDVYIEQVEGFAEFKAQKVDQQRLRRVVKHVRRWLFQRHKRRGPEPNQDGPQ